MTTEIQFTDPLIISDDQAVDPATATAADQGADPDNDATATGDAATEGAKPAVAADAVLDGIAQNIGWQPRDEYLASGGDPDKWKSAKDYIEQTPKILKNQRNEIKGLKKSVEDLKTFHGKILKSETGRLKKEIDALKAERDDAIREGDVERVGQIDEQVDELNDQMGETAAEADPAAPVNPVFNSWLEKNEWYGSDAEMTELAESITKTAKADGYTFSAILAKIDRAIADVYPDKVAKKAGADAKKVIVPADSTLAPSRESGGQAAAQATKLSDLPEEAQATAKRFERQGIMSVAQYIKDYNAII